MARDLMNIFNKHIFIFFFILISEKNVDSFNNIKKSSFKNIQLLATVSNFNYHQSYGDKNNGMKFPKSRNFIPLPGSRGLTTLINNEKKKNSPIIFRVQQFNVLADGLSGLRTDLGKFSRASKDILSWDIRKELILHEITQYDADILTLQEVDHYHDFYLPKLNALGYTGYFAPKPTSACLDMEKGQGIEGNNPDGVALFIKNSRMRVVSCETTTLALSIAGLSDAGELLEDDINIKAQNQVGLIAVCEFINWKKSNKLNNNEQENDENNDDDDDDDDIDIFDPPPPLIVSTTHLKSSKSATGERYRQKGVLQILDAVDKIYRSLASIGRRPTIVLAGDFNAIPEVCEYGPPLTYRAVKSHRLGLRSIYNEDVQLSQVPLSSGDNLYTTWKARRKSSSSGEVVVKRCIDYIFYGPYIAGYGKKIAEDPKSEGAISTLPLATKQPVIAFSESQIAISFLLRIAVYLFSVIIPSTCFLSSSLGINDRIFIISLSFIGLATFEIFAKDTIFKPQVAARWASGQSLFPSEYKTTDIGPVGEFGIRMQQISKQSKSDSYPGIRAVAALDLFDENAIGSELLPSNTYPSDHISIASDLSIVW